MVLTKLMEVFIVKYSILLPQGWLGGDSVKKDGFKVSFGPVLQHSLNPSVTLLNWVKVYNAVCTPTPIHRLCTQTFSPPQKTNVLLGIEPADYIRLWRLWVH